MYFPITIIDNFLENFIEIKNYVISQNFKAKDKNTITMPGLATEPLHILNNNYFKLSCNKILSTFFDRFIINSNIQYSCESYFEKIVSYGNQYDNQGWIHRDDENILSCIFYLQGDLNEGTSFFKKKTIGQHNTDALFVKENLYKNEKINPSFYNEKLKEHNSQFDLTLKVPLIENRIVIFDSSIFHCSDGYGSIEKPRLIQTSFFRTITGTIGFPIPEINRIK
jgi:hypothetical protein